MRFPSLVAAVVIGLATAPLPAAAQSLFDTMNEDDRSALRAEIRAYLLDNPEVIFEAVAAFEERNASAQAEMEGALVEINAEDIFFDGHSWAGGNLDGDLILVEFVDYRCSFCRRAFEQVMDFVGDDGNVRLVMKEFPILGPQSEVMSRFAISVLQLGGDDAYFTAHERLLNWDGAISESTLGAFAVELGLDAEAVMAHMSSPEVTAVLDENRALAQRLQISGTPTFVMGGGRDGELIRGLLPAAGLADVAGELRG
ncbi:MAG: DsbA family protein [Pararhodobacter sp.]